MTITSPDQKAVIRFSVDPAEIAKSFTVKLINETKEKTAEIGTTSMSDYCHTMIDSESSPEPLKTLCRSILDYGCAAQDIFVGGHEAEDEAKLPALPYDPNVPTETVLTQENFPKIKADMSFFVLENAKVRLYFDSEISGDNVGITSTFGTVGSGCVASNDEEHDYHYAEIENIKPSDLGKQFSVTIRLNGDEVGTTYTYSALQCVYDIMTACRGQDYNPAELLYPSLVNYYLAAKAYFTSD